mgnify:CR=1 FL=1|tara:strand:+ start:678 stop:1679 length:1002 start_codon:yes stop_codon:yes gene_type:complete
MGTDHEENIKKEFAQAEMPENVEATETPSSVVQDLGKVDTNRQFDKVTSDDPEIIRLNAMVGFTKLDLNSFPSKGKFYRDDFELHIRPAKVAEVRAFSTIDENNLMEVDEGLNNLVISCTKVTYGSQRGSYRDILEEDRIYLILSIRELTFKSGEHTLMMPVSSRSCKSSTCNAQDSVELRTNNLQFNSVVEKFEKYYDAGERCYSIATKNYGVIHMAPPTIGVMRAITDYIRDKEEKNQNWDKSTLAILPYLQREWRGWNDKDIFAKITSFQGWDSTKYTIVYRLAEDMKVGVKPEMVFPCKTCSEEVTVPLTFPGGIKSLFLIPDISTELL